MTLEMGWVRHQAIRGISSGKRAGYQVRRFEEKTCSHVASPDWLSLCNVFLSMLSMTSPCMISLIKLKDISSLTFNCAYSPDSLCSHDSLDLPPIPSRH